MQFPYAQVEMATVFLYCTSLQHREVAVVICNITLSASCYLQHYTLVLSEIGHRCELRHLAQCFAPVAVLTRNGKRSVPMSPEL